MRSKGFLLLVIALLQCALSFAQSPPLASIDRSVVSVGDSLTLTVSVEGERNGEPDFAVLEKDFQLFGSSQSTQHSLVNGRLSSRTEWQISLMPKRSGTLTIPSIPVGSAATRPLALQVNEAGSSDAHDGTELIFIETQTDRDSVYVQQQLLFTVRVFVAVQLQDLQLTKPEFDNASVKQIAEATYRREINGTAYAVHELTYAIFPQQSGELTIPELVFSGTEVTRSRSLFDFPGQGRTLRKMSRQMRIEIKPIPAEFTGKVWLPARHLTLISSWNGNIKQPKVGESLTRSIAIQADGLLAAHLPALEQPTLDNAKLYADQAALDDQNGASGVRGKRVENTTLIPTRPGVLRLPETRIVWWDVDSDSEKVASLDGESLTIAAASGASSATAAPSTPSPPAAIENEDSQPGERLGATPPPQPVRLWQALSAVLALLWLATLALWWRARSRSPRLKTPGEVVAPTQADTSPSWQAFAAACHANEPAVARQKLLQWAALFYDDPALRTIDQLQAHGDAALTRELMQLENRLFGTLRDSSEWNGENLLQVVSAMKNRHAVKSAAETALPPLYPLR